jgi:hypothetical protein
MWTSARIGGCIFGQHAPGIASDQVARAGMPVDGAKDPRCLVAEIRDERLSAGAFVKRDLLLEILGVRYLRLGRSSVMMRHAEAASSPTSASRPFERLRSVINQRRMYGG